MGWKALDTQFFFKIFIKIKVNLNSNLIAETSNDTKLRNRVIAPILN